MLDQEGYQLDQTKYTEKYLLQPAPDYERNFKMEFDAFKVKHGGDGSVYIKNELREFRELSRIGSGYELLNDETKGQFGWSDRNLDKTGRRIFLKATKPDYEFFKSCTLSKIDFLEKKLIEIENLHLPGERGFQPNPVLNEIIFPGYVNQFDVIERELISRKYLTDEYKWIGTKTALCEFLVVIINLDYPLKKKNGKPIKPLAIRKFFEQRYGVGSGYLAEQFKPSNQPEFETAKIIFQFIPPHEIN